jgi:hypothetical protein
VKRLQQLATPNSDRAWEWVKWNRAAARPEGEGRLGGTGVNSTRLMQPFRGNGAASRVRAERIPTRIGCSRFEMVAISRSRSQFVMEKNGFLHAAALVTIFSPASMNC